MLSSVFLSGRLGRLLDSSTRMIELDAIAPNRDGNFVVTEIPVRPASRSQAYFLRAQEGGYIVIKGRLAKDKDIGLYVLSEVEEYVGKNK